MTSPSSLALIAVGDASRAAADAAATLLTEAGYARPRRAVVSADRLQRAVQAAAALDGCVIVVGGLGQGPTDRTRAALTPLFTRPIHGFSDIYRLVSFRDAGASALLHDAIAGYVGPALVVGVPADPASCERAIDEVLLPVLPELLESADSTAAVPSGARVETSPAEVSSPDAAPTTDDPAEDEPEADDGPSLPPPQPRWQLGRPAVATEAAPIEAEPPADPEAGEIPDRGWKRAVYDLEAEVVRGKAADTPQNLENFAPFMEILHQAGERARLVLPSGATYDIYGFPDLQRANSKVLAVGWGEPLAEVIALHRYPVQAGLSIDEARGIMPRRDSPIRDLAVAITGRAPADTSGELFAVDHDAIYIQRGKWVFKWDGRRERQEGNPRQTLVTLALGWHSR